MDATHSTERITEVESKLAYHDKDIAELNAVVYEQQKQLDALERLVKKMSEQLQELGFDVDPRPDQPPPHY